jgi:hypothetical protein
MSRQERGERGRGNGRQMNERKAAEEEEKAEEEEEGR